MRYEPLGYIYEYEICAILFLAILMMRYFTTRRFPNQKNKFFSLILVCTSVDLVLDVVSSLIIENVFFTPISIVYIVNSVFYLMQLIMPLLMTFYTFSLSEHLNKQRVRQLYPLFIPGLVLLAIILTNPLTKYFFYVDPLSGYIHGKMFIFAYLICLFYLAVTFGVTLRNKKKLLENEYNTVRCFIFVVVVSIVIQFMHPALLISGVAIALSVTMMYFTIQNPETLLNTTTGAFTYDAMLTFLQDREKDKDHVQLVAIQINNMHRINELLGVEKGSLFLKQVCRFMQLTACNSWIFRLHGNCFVAITRQYADYQILSAQLEKRIGELWAVDDTEIMMQATVCCMSTADLQNDPLSPQEIINYLETAFIQNERAGVRAKNIIMGAELTDNLRRRRAVEVALRAAIKSGEGLELYFQPLWSVKCGRFTNAEVLLRFHHPTMGDISPNEFVPIAESEGMVTAMDELVVRKTCDFIRNCYADHDLGLESLEVNLSALEFMHRRLPELLDEIMLQHQVNPKFLIFEITETAATESFELLGESMLNMCKKGFRFALDDFGTGYANISQVIQLPFSIVKLDRSMLLGSELVLEDMVRMFARMNRLTVVEGVELPSQAELVKSIQADYIQGFYFARPMNQDKFIAFLKRNAREYGKSKVYSPLQ